MKRKEYVAQELVDYYKRRLGLVFVIAALLW